uniref:Uncharacterized protein n=1 Tax=Anguilla anguilla TaxID=7936 RepID=A0A0E9UBZ3_ANGAN
MPSKQSSCFLCVTIFWSSGLRPLG